MYISGESAKFRREFLAMLLYQWTLYHVIRYSITNNVPLFLEVRDLMFFRREKHIISRFAGFFLRGLRLF
jgi:hypothetical protein